MTQEQLNILATKVMGWEKDKVNYFDGWSNKEKTYFCACSEWIPHKDLNQALLLLDCYNELDSRKNNFITLDYFLSSWEIEYFPCLREKDNSIICKTEELALELCKVILSKLI